MKKRLLFWMIFIWVAFLVPLILSQKNETAEPGSALPAEVTVLDADTGEEMTLPMEEYIKGVVAAEMPASFESEALKAQAVAARTYTVKHMGEGTHEGHPNVDACTDFTHCKAYKSEADAKADWGADGEKNWAKISSAVDETAGEIVVYEEKPIDAVFHAAAAGQTADAEDVWGAKIPYLQSVQSGGEEAMIDYETSVSVPFAEFCRILKEAHPDIEISESSQIGAPTVGSGGYVKSVEIGGVAVKGTELRTLFSLRSAAFSLSATEDTVTFSVTGYGHGVGLSQYGANAMAKRGADYKEILTTYYTGTTVEKR